MTETAYRRPLGRPPSTTGEETRTRLLDAARWCFAEFGYAGTSNREVAKRAGLTSGAIYHYFESKHELYLAAYVATQERIFGAYGAAVAECTSFRDEVTAILEESVRLNREDRSLALFLAARSNDARRYPELAPDRTHPSEWNSFFGSMVARAVARGDLQPSQVEPTLLLLRVVTSGLMFAASDDLTRQQDTVRALAELVASSPMFGPLIR